VKLSAKNGLCVHQLQWLESDYYDGEEYVCIWCNPELEKDEIPKMPLEMNKYQRIARGTAIYKDLIIYPALGLAGEAGEVAEKIKKLIRDKGGIQNLLFMEEEDRQAIAKEVGDVLWYCANIAKDLGMTLEDVARINIGKLAKRKEEGTLSGSGDDR